MSRKKLDSIFDFMENDPYKSIINILRIAPEFDKRLRTGLKTQELRHLLVGGYSGNKGFHRIHIINGLREYISNKYSDKIKLDQDISEKEQAFNNLLKRSVRNGLIEKNRKNRWVLSKKCDSFAFKNEIILQIQDADAESILETTKDESIGYGIFFLSRYMKDTIADKYTREKFSHAIESIKKGRNELLEINLQESRVISSHFRDSVLASITPQLDKNLAEFFTYHNIDRIEKQYPNNSLISKDYIDIIMEQMFDGYKDFLSYDKKSKRYTINNHVHELALGFKKIYYPSKKIGEISSMLNGYQINPKASALIKNWQSFYMNAFAINDDISFVIPPPFFMVDIPIYLPDGQDPRRMGKSIDNNCKFDVTDIIKNVKNEKDLINIFREYMRLLGLIGVNALSDKSKSALNEIRAYFYKDF